MARLLLILLLQSLAFVTGLQKLTAQTIPLPKDVEGILQREADGLLVDRRAAISGDDPISRWHSGVLMIQGEPVRYEDLGETPKNVSYRKKRSETKSNLQHFELATWCLQHGLDEQYRAHLNYLLRQQPDNILLRSLLEHRLYKGRWFTPYEVSLVRQAANDRAKSVVKWVPSLERIVKQLASKNRGLKAKAMRALSSMDEPDVVYAIEFLLPHTQTAEAILFTNKIGEFKTREACTVLLNIGLSNEVPAQAKELARELVHQNFAPHVYVPHLMSALEVVHESHNSITSMPNGDLVLNQLVIKESQDSKQLHRFRKYVATGENVDVEIDKFGLRVGPGYFYQLKKRRTNISPADPNLARVAAKQRELLQWKWLARTLELTSNEFFSDGQALQLANGDIAADDMQFAMSLAEDQAILNSQIESIRRGASRRNEAIIDFLYETQGVDPGPTAMDWWNWWDAQNDRYTKRKPTQVLQSMQYESNQAFEAGVVTQDSKGFCLAPETQVQTERGLVPCAELEIGDLVVSQNVESGELLLKPIFAITSRPPGEIYQLEIGNEVIKATSGHMWWVSGYGWRRTRELKSGMLLHTLRGNVVLDALTTEKFPDATYNLIVADFHTFFAGKSRLLCNDNMNTNSTVRSVPGYGTAARK